MRLRSVLSEAWRNTTTATTRPLAFALWLIFAVAGLALADTVTLADLEQQATRFHVTGGSTYILSADHAVSGVACDRLSQVGGIEASGALRTAPEGIELAALPGAPIPLLEVTPSFAQVIGLPESAGGGLALSPDAATTLGAGAGDTVTLMGGRHATVNGVYAHPDDGRLQALRYAALAPVAADDVFDQCWATVWPPSPETQNLLNTAIAGKTPSIDATISQFNSTLGASFDGPALFSARLTAWAPPLAACSGLLVGLLSIRVRRLELASALHARVPRTALLTQLAAETLLWVIPAALIGAVATTLTAILLAPSHAEEVLSIGLRSLGAGASTTLLGALLGGMLTRERDLLRYFKER